MDGVIIYMWPERYQQTFSLRDHNYFGRLIFPTVCLLFYLTYQAITGVRGIGTNVFHLTGLQLLPVSFCLFSIFRRTE